MRCLNKAAMGGNLHRARAAVMVAGRSPSAVLAPEGGDRPIPRVGRTGVLADVLQGARLGEGLGQRSERKKGRGEAPEQKVTQHQGLLGSGFRQP
jgi:hypothetical protein